MTPLHKLYAKLCRELAQSEHSAVVHTRREARRLGDVPPAHALLTLGAHARAVRARYESLMATRAPIGSAFARTIGGVFSTLRHYIFDRVVDVERSYRGTLLGFHHGIAVARLLRDVAIRQGDTHLVMFCDDWLADRIPLLEAAERELSWFADRPACATASGRRIAFVSATE